MRTLSIVLGLCIFLAASERPAAQEEKRRYLEVKGDVAAVVELTVVHSAGAVEARSSGGGVTDVVRWQPGQGTVSWQQVDTRQGSSLTAERTGDRIRVTGVLKGREVTREIKVDSAPWYQVFGPLLSELLPPGMSQREFWVVDPDDLAPHKMLVRRASIESVEVGGARLEAIRVHFSPAGALAPFWGADFWYRARDAVYLSSRLPENGGVTVTMLEDPAR
jgi:hypothetical protein